MQNFIHGAALFALTLNSAFAAGASDCTQAALPTAQRADEDTIRRVERAWLTAEMRGDVATVSCLLADDYVNISMNGKRYSKRDILQSAAKRQGKNLPIPQVELTIVVQGNAATAYSIQHKHDGDGKPIDVYFADAFSFDGHTWHPYFSNDMALVSGLKITD
jgi:ketosteroid isomerase-like protein